MTSFKIEIDGQPIPLQRPRATKHGFYDPQYIAKKNFAMEVMGQVSISEPISSGIELQLQFIFAEPKSWSKKKKLANLGKPHLQTRDLSNCIKFVEDSLNEKLYLDDAQIYKITASKYWGEKGKTIIEVTHDQA